MRKDKGRRERAGHILKYLKRAYPRPKSELHYSTPFQFLVAVMLSAQCTDKVVNRVTDRGLFKKYRTAKDFAKADLATFTKEISSVTFFNNKARAVIAAAKIVAKSPPAGGFGGKVPESVAELVTLPGVAYKTANVVLGEIYGKWEGIATDTHVKRFAYRFDLSDNRDLTKISKDLEALVPKKDWKFVNNGLVLYGRYVCTARPHDCSMHPLTKLWPKASARWMKTRV